MVELLLSMLLALVVAGTVALVVAPLRLAFEARLAGNDEAQRLRVAADVVGEDVAMAGAGAYAGSLAGPLVHYLPPVLPWRLGVDPPGTVRDDAVTVLYVPATAAQAVLGQALAAAGGEASIGWEPGCPPADVSCGFTAGAAALVYDEGGAFNVFPITAVAADRIELGTPLARSDQVFPAGSKIVQVVVRGYHIDPGDADSGPELMQDDEGSSQPLVDHLVTLRCEYEDGAGSGLPLDGFRDGPWMPNDTEGHRYDADLLRVRGVQITLRAESALDALRGPASVLFSRGGAARAPAAFVPDEEWHLHIAPRNLAFPP